MHSGSFRNIMTIDSKLAHAFLERTQLHFLTFSLFVLPFSSTMIYDQKLFLNSRPVIEDWPTQTNLAVDTQSQSGSPNLIKGDNLIAFLLCILLPRLLCSSRRPLWWSNEEPIRDLHKGGFLYLIFSIAWTT